MTLYNDENKTIEEKWLGIDGFTNEVFPYSSDEVKDKYSSMDILLPPLRKEDGTILKGLISSRAVDYLYTVYHNLSQYFITIANSMWGSFAKSEKADAYFTLYDYPKRVEWYKKNNPQKAGKFFIPYQDADYTNENFLCPIDLDKDIDILMVTRLNPVKNIDILLKALIYTDKKYNVRYKTVLLAGKQVDDSKSDEVYSELIKIAGSEEELKSYIEFVYDVNPSNLCFYYSRAKITALTSIAEGKNRSIQESVLCNTPVICFSDFNKYIRGETPVLPENCAYYAENFTPESFGEKLYEILNSSNIMYNTRNIALKYFGRKNTIDKIIKLFPYYIDNIPEIYSTNVVDNDYINSLVSRYYNDSYEHILYKNLFLSKNVSEKNNILFYMITDSIKSV